MVPVIEIVIIGDEILSGWTIDANALSLINSLATAGFEVRYISVAGDTISEIADILRHAQKRADIVLVTGGLGPTSDDVTVEAVAEAFGLQLILDEDVLQQIEMTFQRRNRIMSESNKKQAMIPAGAEPLPNPIGTAPGIYLQIRENSAKSDRPCNINLMPGVPVEMEAIFRTYVLPRVKEGYKPSSIEITTVRVTGISESQLFDTIKHLPGAREAFAFYPSPMGTEIKIRTNSTSPLNASALRDRIVEIVGDYVYSTKGESIEEVVGSFLLKRGLTIGVAESCTGGLVSHRLTDIPGSSSYFLGSVIAYANEVKDSILGVNPTLIVKHGAVSSEVAGAMAEGVRKVMGADIGCSTTGIAGPSGGSPEKPVGLLFTGISSERETLTKRLQFVEERRINKAMMSQAVLDMLRRYLTNDMRSL